MKSYKHKDTRVHIPSKEEAGYEQASETAQNATHAEYPKNPVVHRGQDPELFWMNKYGTDDTDDMLKVDIRSLYRHEHISPEVLMQRLYQLKEDKNPYQLTMNELFGNALGVEEEDKVGEYYRHRDGWSNRLIQGDSLMVMGSLLEREGMAGKVQTIYFDPPYGIKYGSNWQMKLNNRDVKDGSDEHLSGEPEQIKAFRDTWELGIHSYLSYLRDRLLVARELLTESGSCFVQISDENVHLVRCLMDEIFGSRNFVSQIAFKTSIGLGSKNLDGVYDIIIWYSKNYETIKYRQLYKVLERGEEGATRYNYIELPNGTYRLLSQEERGNPNLIPENSRFFTDQGLTSRTGSETTIQSFEFGGKQYSPSAGGWRTSLAGLKNLSQKGRILKAGATIRFKKFFDDFGAIALTNFWADVGGGIQSRLDPKVYVVQTNTEIVKRCLLMTSDPGDLVLDPTCGSGTTAYVCEQWGRRWIALDTSRIALNIAKTRLMTAAFPYYHLYSDVEVFKAPAKNGKIDISVRPRPHGTYESDIRQGFVYQEVPHITLKSLANDEPPDTEILYDKPMEEKGKLRVAGPFTVETLQSFDVISPEELDSTMNEDDSFEEKIFSHLRSAGIKNGIRNENAVFTRIDRLHSEYLHAEGFYPSAGGEKKAYLHIGPKFGAVMKTEVSHAIRECRQRSDADWLIILGFAFESDIQNESVTASMGAFEVTKVRMHDDLLQEGLLKKGKNIGAFITIGEPEVAVIDEGHKNEDGAPVVQVEIKGLDIYDPIRGEVKPRDIHDIAYWMIDDDYDGSNFVVKQVFFCGGDKDEFDKWRKGLSTLAESRNKRKKEVQQTLKIEIDEEAFDRLYGHVSHPIEKRKGRKIAVRVLSQFGEESTKVVGL